MTIKTHFNSKILLLSLLALIATNAYSFNGHDTLSAVHNAAFSNDISDTTGLRYYFEKAHMPDTLDAYGHNALWYAVEGDALAAADYLLTTYPNFYVLFTPGEEATGQTYMHRAKSPAMVNYLARKGAPLNAVDRDGHTPLAAAVLNAAATGRQDHFDVLQALLENGARLADPVAGVPLAVENAVYKLYGTNPVLASILLGDYSAARSHLDQEKQENSSGFLGRLIGKSKNELYVNKAVHGLSPIFVAVYQNSIPFAALLIMHGVNTDARNMYGDTPYDVAVKTWHSEMEALLHQSMTARTDKERRAVAESFIRRYMTNY